MKPKQKKCQSVEAVVRRCSFKYVLKNFANYTGKRLCCSLFLIKLMTRRPARDSNAVVFL